MSINLVRSASMPTPFSIAGRPVGAGEPCFVIAEAGVNHNGDVALAEMLVDAAAAAGADAVKFQTFRADRVAAAVAGKAEYQRRRTAADESQLAMLRALELGEADLTRLVVRAQRQGLMFLSTPFDTESADLLAALEMPAFKIASGEVTNLPFLEHVARLGRPVMLSTGMSYLGEVDVAVRALRAAGCTQLALLHCVTDYPALAADANLAAMATLRDAFGVPVGFSDHTMGLSVAIAAAALGASIIEKHFTTDRNLAGPDHAASLEPGELTQLVRSIRDAEASIGSARKQPAAVEQPMRALVRRSLGVARPIAAGAAIAAGDLMALRPATGIPPSLLDAVIGRTTARALQAGEILTWQDLA